MTMAMRAMINSIQSKEDCYAYPANGVPRALEDGRKRMVIPNSIIRTVQKHDES